MRKICVTYVSLCLLAACLIGATASICTASQPVVIGVPIPLSGQLKAFGQMMKNAFEMAAEDINLAGGIHSRSVELRFADDKGDAAMVDEAFRHMALAGPVMLVGGYASDATYRMARMAESRDVPFLVSTASADKITQRGWTNIYRLNPPISEYTQGLEDFWIKNFKPKSMVILYEDSMFGTEGSLRMLDFCREQAIEVIAHIGYDRVTLTPGRLRSRLAPLTGDPPDVIYMISYFEDALMLVKGIKALGIKSMLCGGGGGFTLEAFAKSAGADAEFLFTAALWSDHVDTLDSGSFHKKYAQRFGHKTDYHGAEAYSALMVAAEALRRAKSFEPQNIRQALNSIYMKTPFGPVKFYSYGDFERQNSIHTLVLQIINGKYETVWPPDKASADFILPKRD